MGLARSQIRADILEKPCPECRQLVPEDGTGVLTFYRGEFLFLHEDCFTEFYKRGGPRPDPDAHLGATRE